MEFRLQNVKFFISFCWSHPHLHQFVVKSSSKLQPLSWNKRKQVEPPSVPQTLDVVFSPQGVSARPLPWSAVTFTLICGGLLLQFPLSWSQHRPFAVPAGGCGWVCGEVGKGLLSSNIITACWCFFFLFVVVDAMLLCECCGGHRRPTSRLH